MNWEVSNVQNNSVQTTLFEDLTNEEQEIITLLRQDLEGINVNEMTIRLNKPYSHLSSQLLEMEFKGIVKSLPGGVYRVVK
jgi:DNA processing protein